LCADHEQLIE